MQSDTIVAIATPSGESALGLIRCSGPACLRLCAEALGKPGPTPRRATLARYQSTQSATLDEVIFTYYPPKNSFTGEAMLELSAHGNPYLLRKILDDLLARGCRLAEPGEFTKLAFLNGRLDLSQAEAVLDVIRARSDAALAAAQKQLSGSVGRSVEAFVARLLAIMAHLEAYIDFPEEDLPEEDQAGPAQELKALIADFTRLIATSSYSTLLREGARAVIIGLPNAGKSSLLNALAGEERAIVSEEPGTTRDYLETPILVGPYLLRLIDTAGLRDTTGTIERLGIAKTREQISQADLLLVVADASLPDTSSLENLTKEFASSLSPSRIIILENKADLPSFRPLASFFPASPHLPVSAKTGLGLDTLREKLALLLEQEISVPGQDAIIVNARHAHALEEARQSLQSALSKMADGLPAELVASELRLAIEALGQITGRIDNERMLDILFSKFCIGK